MLLVNSYLGSWRSAVAAAAIAVTSSLSEIGARRSSEDHLPRNADAAVPSAPQITNPQPLPAASESTENAKTGGQSERAGGTSMLLGSAGEPKATDASGTTAWSQCDHRARTGASRCAASQEEARPVEGGGAWWIRCAHAGGSRQCPVSRALAATRRGAIQGRPVGKAPHRNWSFPAMEARHLPTAGVLAILLAWEAGALPSGPMSWTMASLYLLAWPGRRRSPWLSGCT